jgi:hypothetical protein
MHPKSNALVKQRMHPVKGESEKSFVHLCTDTHDNSVIGWKGARYAEARAKSPGGGSRFEDDPTLIVHP